MPQFRKKPVVIEAMCLNAETTDFAIVEWAARNGVEIKRDIEHRNATHENPDGFMYPCLRISTLEGVMTASVGDWVIRGVKGEFYPCKPEIFEATYEPVEG